ncbi:MAG: ABC transporter ATP-binding protein [Calothrix sp. C42_A2020_038]|nr:ABC transporter ATP-binding protein [Calothrix sp. C42_A2020_038]
MPSLKRVLGILTTYRLLVLGAITSLLLLIAINAITPQLFRWGIDQGIAKGNLDVIFKCALFLVLAAIGRGLFSFGQSFFAEATSQNIAYNLRNQIFTQTQYLSQGYYNLTTSGQLLTRITTDIEQIRTFFGTSLLQILSGLITLVTSALILLSMNWKLALITLASIPIAGFILVRFFRNNSHLFKLVQAQLGNLNGILEENLLGVRVVKAFVREQAEVSRYTTLNGELLASNMKTVKVLRNVFPVLFLIGNLITLTVLGFGGAEVINNQLSLGELVAFNSYLVFILQPVLQIGFASGVIAQAAASATRVYEVIDAEVDIHNRVNAISLKTCRGEIEFDHVDFRYPGANQNALKKVSFTIKPGEFTAIVGMTGTGKSTIVNLIPRFYDATSGVVKIDGYDVRDLTLDSLRSHVGIVFQDATLFSGTIRDNIAYAVPEAPLEKIIEAAKFAAIDDFISSLPDGYNTVVGERGIGLSGGQKQRIAIARTILTDFSILILDDSTSAVDAKTAMLIQESLNNLMQQRQCTVIMVAQRLSDVRKADLILLLDQGELVAQGTHEELLENQLYATILASQQKFDFSRHV